MDELGIIFGKHNTCNITAYLNLHKGCNTVISHDIYTLYSTSTANFSINLPYHRIKPLFGRMNLVYNHWAVHPTSDNQLSGWFIRCAEKPPSRISYEVYIVPNCSRPLLINTEWIIITHNEIIKHLHEILNTSDGILWRKFPEK